MTGPHLSPAELPDPPRPVSRPAVVSVRADELTDADVDGVFALRERCRLVRAFPGAPGHRAMVETELRYGWEGNAPEVWLVRDSTGPARDSTVVVAELTVHVSLHEDFDKAFVGVRVDPDHRGRGIGGALVEVAETWTRANGRSTLFTTTRAGETADERFADRRGFRVVLKEVLRRQVLAEVDRTALAAAVADAAPRAADYEMVRFHAPVPAEMVEGMVELANALNDAPREDGSWDDEVWTVERIRSGEVGTARRGLAMFTVVARRRSDGVLAGETTVAVHPAEPTYGFQWTTVVSREHRGHRLGLLLKVAMLDWLAVEQPLLRTIDTDNAGSNDHMIAINELLGYQVVGMTQEREKQLTDITPVTGAAG